MSDGTAKPADEPVTVMVSFAPGQKLEDLDDRTLNALGDITRAALRHVDRQHTGLPAAPSLRDFVGAQRVLVWIRYRLQAEIAKVISDGCTMPTFEGMRPLMERHARLRHLLDQAYPEVSAHISQEEKRLFDA